MAGTVLNITNSATDASTPAQTLTFSLTGPTPPAGVSINSSNGIFNWRPTIAQGGTTNPFTVQVADNGAPVMTDAKNFSVIVTSYGVQLEGEVTGPWFLKPATR